MSILGFTWYYIVVFLAVLTVLVYVHELGHYWIARRNKVRVEVFSIGFGPEIYGWTDKHGTRWKISAVPLGGYVKMFGETLYDDDSEQTRPLTPEERAVSFHHKRLGQRAAIVAAGPLANFLFAIVALAGVYGIVGNPAPLAGVGEVLPGSAAAEAGLKPGDRILSIDGKTIKWFEDLRRIVSANPGSPLTLVIRRDGVELPLKATPTVDQEKDADGTPLRVGRLGVRPDPAQIEYERQNPAVAVWMGVERTVALSGQIVAYLGQMIAGSRDAKELGGPLRIAQMSGQVAQGGVVNLIVFMAALSINLGLINLFPIPMLDGGHLIFYAAEAVRGRPVPVRVQEYGFRFGLILVFVLMIFATWNDLVNLRVIEFIRQLIS